MGSGGGRDPRKVVLRSQNARSSVGEAGGAAPAGDGDEQPSGCEDGAAWGLDEGGREGSAGKRPAGGRGEARSSVPNERRHFPALATLFRPNGGAVEASPGGDTLLLTAVDGRAAVDATPGGGLSSVRPGLRAPPAHLLAHPLLRGRPGPSPGPTRPQRSLVTCCLAPPRSRPAGSQSAGAQRVVGGAGGPARGRPRVVGAVEGSRHRCWRVCPARFLAGWPSFPSRTLAGRGGTLASAPRSTMT